jgi:hypothetical protein
MSNIFLECPDTEGRVDLGIAAKVRDRRHVEVGRVPDAAQGSRR